MKIANDSKTKQQQQQKMNYLPEMKQKANKIEELMHLWYLKVIKSGRKQNEIVWLLILKNVKMIKLGGIILASKRIGSRVYLWRFFCFWQSK